MAGGQIEYIHFIFDRYNFLGIKLDLTKPDFGVTKKDIQSALRTKRIENHPDNFVRAGADAKAVGVLNMEALLKCEEVLLNDEARPLYDRRLAEFIKDRPKRIIDDKEVLLGRRRMLFIGADDVDYVDVDFLYSNGQLDLTGIMDQSRILSHYDEQGLARAKKLHEKNPKNKDFRSLYREALERKIIYLDTITKYLWAAAGVSGKHTKLKTLDAKLIGEAVAGQIEHIKTNVIPAQVREHVEHLALGYDKKPILLLTQGDKRPPVKGVSAQVKKTTEKVQSRFETLSKAIQENAEEKAKTISAVLELSPFVLLHKAKQDDILIHLILDATKERDINKGKVVCSIRYTDQVDMIEDYKDQTLKNLKRRSHAETAGVILINNELGNWFLDAGEGWRRAMYEAFGIKNAVLGVNEPQERLTKVKAGHGASKGAQTTTRPSRPKSRQAKIKPGSKPTR